MVIFNKSKEEKIVDVKFNIHKLTDKEKPEDKEKVLIICCFAEFGCESLVPLYCFDRLVKENPDCSYVIVAG